MIGKLTIGGFVILIMMQRYKYPSPQHLVMAEGVYSKKSTSANAVARRYTCIRGLAVCQHIWKIEPEAPDTVLCKGVCSNCGKIKDFLNTKGIYMQLQSPKFHRSTDKWVRTIARLFPDMV